MTILKSAKQIVPTLDRILVQRVKPQQQTASGIYIPEKNLPNSNIATVIAVGPGYHSTTGELIKPQVAPGDAVMIPPHGGSPIALEKEDFLLLREADILAKINNA